MGKLDGKVAIVTGGAMGMGNGTAIVMARCGASVAIVDKSDTVEKAAQELRNQGLNVIGFAMDVTKKDDVKKVFKKVADKFGKIDILVNAAGVAVMKPFLEMSDEIRDLMVDVNIKGMWNTCQEAIPYMLKNNYGKIVNFSSVTGYVVADPGEVAYATAKSSIIGMTKALAMEFVKNNITVNAICPGYILTPMVMGVAKEQVPDNPMSVIDAIAAGIPIGRLGTMEEAGDLAAFLASDESRYITGTQIIFDGASTLPETAIIGEV